MYFAQIGNRDDAGIVYWSHSIGKLAPRYHSHFYRTRAHPRSISVLRHVEMLRTEQTPKDMPGEESWKSRCVKTVSTVSLHWYNTFRRGPLLSPKPHAEHNKGILIDIDIVD